LVFDKIDFRNGRGCRKLNLAIADVMFKTGPTRAFNWLKEDTKGFLASTVASAFLQITDDKTTPGFHTTQPMIDFAMNTSVDTSLLSRVPFVRREILIRRCIIDRLGKGPDNMSPLEIPAAHLIAVLACPELDYLEPAQEDFPRIGQWGRGHCLARGVLVRSSAMALPFLDLLSPVIGTRFDLNSSLVAAPSQSSGGPNLRIFRMAEKMIVVERIGIVARGEASRKDLLGRMIGESILLLPLGGTAMTCGMIGVNLVLDVSLSKLASTWKLVNLWKIGNILRLASQ